MLVIVWNSLTSTHGRGTTRPAGTSQLRTGINRTDSFTSGLPGDMKIGRYLSWGEYCFVPGGFGGGSSIARFAAAQVTVPGMRGSSITPWQVLLECEPVLILEHRLYLPPSLDIGHFRASHRESRMLHQLHRPTNTSRSQAGNARI